jgi:multiple sugar transport system substrate-binding protein
MKNAVKIISLVVTLVMLVTVLTACAVRKPETEPVTPAEDVEEKREEPREEPREPVHLIMWGGVPPEFGPQAAVDAFNKEFEDRGITVEYVRFVNDASGNLKLETTLMAGHEIDIYVTYSATALRKRAEGGMALDLTELLKRDGLDVMEMFGEMAIPTIINERSYAIPSARSNVHGLILNKNMFEEAGIPIPTSWTFDEFREIAKRLTKGDGPDKVYGFFGNSGQAIAFPGAWVAASLGSDSSFKPGTNFTETQFTHPVFEKAYTTATEMMLEDKTAVSHETAISQKLTIESMFYAGRAAISVGPWTLRNIIDKERFPVDFEIALAPIPVMDTSATYYTPISPGDMISINPRSRNIDEAWEFIKWYIDTGILQLAKFGRLPGYVGFNVDDVARPFLEATHGLVDETSFKSVMIAPPKALALTTFISPPEMTVIVEEEIEAMFLGRKSVREALEAMKTRSDELLRKGR